ncbi:MAG: hypothetical protein ACXIVQ_06710 [Acidimicrobiales bacterium]
MQTSIDFRHVVRLLGLGRIGLGVFMLLSPRRVGRGWIGASATADGGTVAMRAIGARDIAIGWATVNALDSGDDHLRTWVTIAALCDATDAAATVMSFRRLPRWGRFGSVAIAGGAAVVGLIARDQLD